MKKILATLAVLGLSTFAFATDVSTTAVPMNVTVAAIAELHMDTAAVNLTMNQAGPIKQGVDTSAIQRRTLSYLGNVPITVSASLTGNLPTDSVFWIVMNPAAGWTKPQSTMVEGTDYLQWYAGETGVKTAFTKPVALQGGSVDVDYAIQASAGIAATGTYSATVTWTLSVQP